MTAGRRILFLNWRDIRDPRAGGAELLTHELAKHLVGRGDDVTWFTSQPGGNPDESEIDGVRIVRRGTQVTTRLHAPRFARRGSWDLVVEEINTLPWLSPLWSSAPTMLLIPQLAREVWWYEAPLPIAVAGYAAEPVYVRIYRRTPAVTISRSTADDLRRMGHRAPVHILPMAASTPALAELPPKEPGSRLVIACRLVRSKRVADAVRAVAELRRTVPDASLVVIGEGPQREPLAQLARELGIGDAVRLTGRIPEAEKMRLLEEATLLLASSAREGWGLTVTEAARVGTPAVAYRVPGLRDSVVDGRTGILTDPTPSALAAGISRVLGDREHYGAMREAAWRHARDLTWERTGAAFARIVDDRC